MEELQQETFFWGKFLSDSPQYKWLPLSAHCLDVALVFRALCDLNGIRRALTCATKTAITSQQLDRLAVLAMLHDAGKANLGFQRKVFDIKAPKAGHLRELAPILDFRINDTELLTAFMQALPSELHSWFNGDQDAYSYLMAIFSHHGRPLKFSGEMAGTYWLARRTWWRRQGQQDPMAAVADITYWAQQAFPLAFNSYSPRLPAEPRFHHRFAGLLMLADWLGSHRTWFPVENCQLKDRLQHDREVIPSLLYTVGLDVTSLRAVLNDGPRSFQERFGFTPRPLQAAIDTLDVENETTRLVIAESETGSGKTEAALDWFFKLFTAGKVDGLYFALPTRVAARELYNRVKNVIDHWFPDPSARPVTVLAVPGYAQIDGVSLKKALPDPRESGIWQDDEELCRRERQWAAEHPKRFLAATIAVGTIDQALLSVVKTAHAHLRSICLDRSLLVIDEVHASDHYMSCLLEALLHHHLGIGGRAMLLSATLGAQARHRYTNDTQGTAAPPNLTTAQNAPYPSITLADGGLRAVDSSSSWTKKVRFKELPLAFKPDAVVEHIIPALSAGARVLVVMNTVERANNLLRTLESHTDINPTWLFHCHGVICPHHGRFAPEDRALLDAHVSKRLGSGSEPGPLCLIGTQTLEQSLDIDADLLISDLAPADVLLQRVGRLHRHQRQRPLGYETPYCLVLTPEEELEVALNNKGEVAPIYKHIGYGSIYDDLRTMELTRKVLAERPVISIPEDNRWLVESVTHPEKLSSLSGERWKLHGQSVGGEELAKALAASLAITAFDEHFGECEFSDLGESITTRLGLGSLQLPLDRQVTSPFGQTLRNLVIPGQMAPKQPDEFVAVKELQGDIIILGCADRHYRYSRYGLEEVK